MSSTVADAPVDLRQHGKWKLPLQPDVLITPSKLQPFARDVQGCLVLNPGHLSKGAGGGTFSQLTVHPLNGLRKVTRRSSLLGARRPGAHARGDHAHLDSPLGPAFISWARRAPPLLI